MSRPFWMIEPVVCDSRPAMQRKSVVLPQPEGPRKQMNSPVPTPSEMSRSATKFPNIFARSRTAR